MDHGRSRYVAGCRCPICTAANRRYQRDRARQLRRPDSTPPVPMVDAEATRRRLDQLHADGWTLARIAREAGVARTTLHAISTGDTTRTHRRVHDAVVHAYRTLRSRPHHDA